MNPAEFATKWSGSTRNERAAAQEHFIDLCRMLGVPTPNEADPTGDWYAFEKGIGKAGGGEGFADVWKRRHFAWEYKGKRKDLTAAYAQLQTYRDALENPPILVVCDLNRFEVRTNFTNTPTRLYEFDLEQLRTDPAEPLRIFNALMKDPEELRPREAADELTAEAAGRFAHLAVSLRDRGEEPQRVAHFLDKLLFCLYAEDAGVLPKGLLSRLADATKAVPAAFADQLSAMFEKMAHGGGYFGVDQVEWMNGGLFADADVLVLTRDEIEALLTAGRLDWSLVEPAIFGTLFERGLDPGKRTQLGAHYTDRASIERLVEPVVLEPLRREMYAMRARVADLLVSDRPRARAKALDAYHAFLARLRAVRVLDPACGSGNFLYVALRKLKDLEFDAIAWGSETFAIPMEFPQVGPEAVMGIEINPYAADLARLSIWIGEIQWHLNHGFAYRREPVLRTLDNVRTGDALIDRSDPTKPQEVEWPKAEFIVGNPPFLGGKMLRLGLGDSYVDDLFAVYADRIPREVDLCVYWHEKGRAAILAGRTRRAGLLATQAIRGGWNRAPLDRALQTGGIFFARSDDRWVLDGANVHIAFVGQDDGSQADKTLDGLSVPYINSDLTSGADLTKARRLAENAGIAFIGDQLSGPFHVSEAEAQRMLAAHNPDGRRNAEVLRPWVSGEDLTGHSSGKWVVDLPAWISEEEASLWAEPFAFLARVVKPMRDQSRLIGIPWWQHKRPAPDMRRAAWALPRFAATSNVAKHRIWVWLTPPTLPGHACTVVARDDDFTFGVIQSHVHDIWSRRTGTQLREQESGARYTPRTSFETFPFPEASPGQRLRIAAAAKRLVELRDGWLTPSGASADELVKLTLTRLYNEQPAWFRFANVDLDAAVLDAYGLPADADDTQILAHLLELNLSRATSSSVVPGAARVGSG